MSCNSAHVHTLCPHGNHTVVYQSQPRARPNINHNIVRLSCDQMSEQQLLVCHLGVSCPKPTANLDNKPFHLVKQLRVKLEPGDETRMVYKWG